MIETYKDLINGSQINFSISFDAPLDNQLYKTFTVLDKIVDGLSFDKYNTLVKAGNDIIFNWNFEYNESDRMVKINIYNSELVCGKKIQIILATQLTNKDAINKETLSFNNCAQVLVNEDTSLSTLSTEVQVKFKEIQNYELFIMPESQNQLIPSNQNNQVFFSTLFNAVEEDDDHKKYNIITTLPDGLTFVQENSSVVLKEKKNVLSNLMRIKIESLNDEKLDATYDYDKSTRKLLIKIPNSKNFYKNEINVIIATKIENAEKIKEEVNFSVELGFNDDIQKISDIKTIKIKFIKDIDIKLISNKSKKILKNGMSIIYSANFKIPKDAKNIGYNVFTITDKLPDQLIFDIKNSSVKTSDGIDIESNILYPKDKSTGLIAIEFYNYEAIIGKEIVVNIGTIIQIKDNMLQIKKLLNSVSLIINGEKKSKINSNIVEVNLLTQDDLNREEALNNVVQSIAMVENSLSTILKGEANKKNLSKVLVKEINDLNKVNSSIFSMITSINILENIIISKLRTVKDAEKSIFELNETKN